MTPQSTRTHMLVRVGPADLYRPTLPAADKTLPLVLQAPGTAGANHVADTAVWAALDQHGLQPSVAAVDFYRVAAAVYSADNRVPRDDAFDRWTRDLVLHLPVSDLAAWERAHRTLVQLLCFLTGDRWEVILRAGGTTRPAADARKVARAQVPDIDHVALMSGGLDSFVGALDAAADGRRALLVSHNSLGPARFSSPAQEEVLRAVRRVSGQRVAHLRMNVSPPPTGGGPSETTQRSRSIIFVAVGVLAASAYRPGMPLVIAENGFISLNVPMTYGRLGSLSTRTTHPYTIALMREVLQELGIPVPLETPYQFATKGAMLVNTRARAELEQTVHATNSCGRPNDRNADPDRPEAHCGYCVPCIIRRAAMRRAGLDDARRYRFDVLTERDRLLETGKRQDPWAFEMALARAARRATVTDVLRGGPLPASPGPDAYVRVYREGLDEVSRFLHGRPLF